MTIIIFAGYKLLDMGSSYCSAFPNVFLIFYKISLVNCGVFLEYIDVTVLFNSDNFKNIFLLLNFVNELELKLKILYLFLNLKINLVNSVYLNSVYDKMFLIDYKANTLLS